MKRVALTTIDNPFDPFSQFEEWFVFDVAHGYNSCELLDRIARTSDTLSDEQNWESIEDAIDEIVRIDLTGTRVKYIETELKKQKTGRGRG